MVKFFKFAVVVNCYRLNNYDNAILRTYFYKNKLICNYLNIYLIMNETFGNRVEAVLKDKGLKKSEFCRMTGFSHVTLSNIINNKTLLPSISILNTISEHFPEVDMNWLVTGKGKMYRSAAAVLGEEDKEKLPPETKEAMLKLIDTQEKLLKMVERDVERIKKTVKEKNPGLAKEIDW